MIKLKTLLILAFVSISLTISFEAKAQEDDWDDPWDMEEDGVDIIAECLYCDYCCGAGCIVCEDDPFLWDDPFEEDMCMLSCGCCGSCCDCDPSLCKEEEPDEKPTYDCAGVKNGDAYVDACGDCVGGNTGAIPCDPCERNREELQDFAEDDIENCNTRRNVDQLDVSGDCPAMNSNLLEYYENAFQNKLLEIVDPLVSQDAANCNTNAYDQASYSFCESLKEELTSIYESQLLLGIELRMLNSGQSVSYGHVGTNTSGSWCVPLSIQYFGCADQYHIII